jgi:hypothetical protein
MLYEEICQKDDKGMDYLLDVDALALASAWEETTAAALSAAARLACQAALSLAKRILSSSTATLIR